MACSKGRSGILRRVAIGALGATALCAYATQSAAQVTLDPIDVAAGKPRKKRGAQVPPVAPASTGDQDGGAQSTPSAAPAGSSEPKGFQGTPDWVYNTPASVSVISRETLEQRTPRNTSDLFQDMWKRTRPAMASSCSTRAPASSGGMQTAQGRNRPCCLPLSRILRSCWPLTSTCCEPNSGSRRAAAERRQIWLAGHSSRQLTRLVTIPLCDGHFRWISRLRFGESRMPGGWCW